jgi:hypothetical protein
MFQRFSYKWLLFSLALIGGLITLSYVAYAKASSAAGSATDCCQKVQPSNELILESASRQFVSTFFIR